MRIVEELRKKGWEVQEPTDDEFETFCKSSKWNQTPQRWWAVTVSWEKYRKKQPWEDDKYKIAFEKGNRMLGLIIRFLYRKEAEEAQCSNALPKALA